MPPRSTRGATRAPGSRAGAGGATRRATRPSATPRGGAPCTPKTRASRSARESLRSPRSRGADPASMRTKRPIRSRLAFRRSRLETPTTGKLPCAPPVPVWNWLQALGTPSPREAKNWHFDRIVWQTVWDFANVLFHALLSVLNFAKPKCRDSQFANTPTAKPFLRLPFRPSAAIWHAPKTHPRQVHRKMGVFLASGMRGEGSGRGRPPARHFRTHPTFHRSSWLLLSPPTSSLALTLSSSACRARSPTRTPVRTSRAARVAKRTISHDTTAAETARPGATRRARRFRRSRADIQPPPPLRFQVRCRAQERQGRAQPPGASRVVALSLRYLATRGLERKRDARSAPDVARVRVARARQPPRARRAIEPGHGRTRSSRFRSVPTRVPPHPRHRRLVRTRHPGVDAPLEQVAPARFSNHERAELARSVTNPPAVFWCFFVFAMIDRSTRT